MCKSQSIKKNPCVATIGFFDGFHLGHQFIAQQVINEARREHLQSCIITFDQHPRRVLHKDYQPELLTTNEEKNSLIRNFGIDHCEFLHFTPEMSLLSAEDFMRDFLKEIYNVKELIIGYDHRFGHSSSEGFLDYQAYGKKMGIEVKQVSPFELPDHHISSTCVRRLLNEGNVNKAKEALGRHYSLSGKVVEGQKNGRKIGFPTANIEITEDKLIPKIGVYAVQVEFNGEQYAGMLNIGRRPTFNNGDFSTIEVHIIDFDGDLYDKTLKLFFIEKMRDEKKFDSIALLQEQLEIDKNIAKKIIQL